MSKLINAEVNIPINISKLVKNYVSYQSNNQQTPFQNMSKTKSSKKPKKSLQDWRVLFTAKKKQNTTRLYSSDRKFYRNQNIDDKRVTSRTQTFNKKYQNKSTVSYRESYLDSAIVQNFYEEQYINERKIRTAQIRRHYEKNPQIRPIMTSQNKRRLNYQDNNNSIRQFGFKTPNQAKRKIYFHMQQAWPQKYDNVKIKRKYIRKCNDIIIEGLKQFKNNSIVEGLLYQL